MIIKKKVIRLLLVLMLKELLEMHIEMKLDNVDYIM